jgi:hypothetical protein
MQMCTLVLLSMNNKQLESHKILQNNVNMYMSKLLALMENRSVLQMFFCNQTKGHNFPRTIC